MHQCIFCEANFVSLHELSCHKRRRHGKGRAENASIRYKKSATISQSEIEEQEVVTTTGMDMLPSYRRNILLCQKSMVRVEDCHTEGSAVRMQIIKDLRVELHTEMRENNFKPVNVRLNYVFSRLFSDGLVAYKSSD